MSGYTQAEEKCTHTHTHTHTHTDDLAVNQHVRGMDKGKSQKSLI